MSLATPTPTNLVPFTARTAPRRWLAVTTYQHDARRAIAHTHFRGTNGETTLGSGAQIVPALDPEPQNAYALDVFEKAYKDAEAAYEDLYVIMRVADVRDRLTEMTDQLPRMRLVDVITRGTVSDRAHTAAHQLTRAALDEDAKKPHPALHVATDASMQTGRSGAGISAVAADGRALMRFDKSYNDVLSAELGAMRLALKEFRAKRIVIESDSKTGVQLANRMMRATLEEEAALMSSDLPSPAKRALRTIKRHSAQRDITIRWVRGHENHQMNLAADRLAVLARRSDGDTVPRDVVENVAENILSEHLPAIAPHLDLGSVAA